MLWMIVSAIVMARNNFCHHNLYVMNLQWHPGFSKGRILCTEICCTSLFKLFIEIGYNFELYSIPKMPMRALYLCIIWYCLIDNKENEMRHSSDGWICISSALIAVFLLLKLSLCKLLLHNFVQVIWVKLSKM